MTANLKYMDSDGATILPALTLADAIAGANQTPRKLAIQNNGDRKLTNVQITITQVGSNDGSLQLKMKRDTTTLAAPWGVTAVLGAAASGGVWTVTGVKGFVVVAYFTSGSYHGETIASVEVTVNVNDTSKKVTLSWPAVLGATGYKVFDTDTAGTYGASSLRADVGNVLTYDDLGGARSAGTPQLYNNSGDWFILLALSGAAAGGVWGGTGVKYYRVVALDSTGVIVTASREVSINVDDVTKKVTLSWPIVIGAATYQIYRSTSSGTYISPAVVASTAALSYVDDGHATTVGTLTQSPSYGAPPTGFDSVPILFGDLEVNQQVFFWINRVVLISVPETGNPRLVILTAKET